MGKRVVRVKPKAVEEAGENEPRRSPFVPSEKDPHDEEQYIQEKNRYAREHGIDNSKPAENISRVVTIQFSAGNDMRDVNLYDFTQRIFDAVGKVPYGKPGIHAIRMNGYYIIDGKLCHEVDIDWEKQNFKDGRTPPEYAGGPKPYKPPVKTAEPRHRAKLMTAEEIKLRYPVKSSAVRHHKWSESHVRTGRPDHVIDEEKNAAHIAEKLKGMRARIAAKKSALSEPPRKKVVVKRKVDVAPVKKKVVVRKAK